MKPKAPFAVGTRADLSRSFTLKQTRYDAETCSGCGVEHSGVLLNAARVGPAPTCHLCGAKCMPRVAVKACA